MVDWLYGCKKRSYHILLDLFLQTKHYFFATGAAGAAAGAATCTSALPFKNALTQVVLFKIIV
jgi:hypothetical protein